MPDRESISDFALANPIYAGAIVTAYTVSNGVKTATKATLYEAATGSNTLANPQTLDSDGKFKQPVYFEEAIVLTITGLTIPDHDTGIIRPSLDASAVDEVHAKASEARQMAGAARRSELAAADSAEEAAASAASLTAEGMVLGIQVFS